MSASHQGDALQIDINFPP